MLNSDFASTSVSLINTQAGLVRADCVHSTTTGSGAKTISGDVVLPSQPQRGGQVVLVDRGNIALTFVNPTTCAFDHQISVKGGFDKANPHDVVIVSDSKAYVTRYGKNATPGSRIEDGDDVLMVDPRDGTVGGRIDLSAYATTDNPAAPDRAIIAAGKVVVTLNRWNADFYTYAKGSVVIIDPETDRVVQNLPLGRSEELRRARRAPGDEDRPRRVRGIVRLRRAGPRIRHRRDRHVDDAGDAGEDHLGRRVPHAARDVRLGRAATVSHQPDARVHVDAGQLHAQRPRPPVLFRLRQRRDDFVRHGVAVRSREAGRGTNGRLLVPDAKASMPRIHVFDTTGAGAPTESSAFVADSVNGLPPREIAWY